MGNDRLTKGLDLKRMRGNELPTTFGFKGWAVSRRNVRKTRVLLADQETIFAAGIKVFLEERFTVVGIATDGEALRHANEQLKPDVIIVDLAIPMMNGIEALIGLRNRLKSPKIIVDTVAADVASVTEVFGAGAAGYVLRTSPPSEFLNAVDKVVAGGRYISPLVPFDVARLRKPVQAERRPLTQREKEVLQLVAEGKTSKEIAAALDISPKTVESHRENISRNLDLHTIAELTRYAIERGLLWRARTS